jgi:hypothetical protein
MLENQLILEDMHVMTTRRTDLQGLCPDIEVEIDGKLSVQRQGELSVPAHRNNNRNLQFQIRFLQYAVLFFAFSSILLFFVKIHSCSSFVESW